MGTNLPAASSSHQPFAHPQPAPVPATSPPTKQSLKSWWKGFRPPQKTQESAGNYSSSDAQLTPAHFWVIENFPTKVPRNLTSVFYESSMEKDSPASEGIPGSLSPAAIIRELHEELINESHASRDLFVAQVKEAHLTEYRQRPSSSLFVLRDIGNSCWRKEKSKAASLDLLSPPHLGQDALPAKLRASTANRDRLLSNASDVLPKAEKVIPDNKAPSFFRISSIKRLCFKNQDNSKPNEKAVPPPTTIFGVPLRTSITYANVAISLIDGDGKSYIYGYVPIVVAKCGVYLKERATNVEGIFRLSGSAKRIKELQAIFDSPDRYGKGLDWEGYTVHDAANVLRRYLNNLPEPIVPLDLYDKFRAPLRGHTKEAVGDSEGPQLEANFDISAAIVTYQHLITELPPLNRQLLLYILDLLAVFASKSDENRMTSQNLAAIFQPGMLSHPQHDMAPSEYRLSQDVLIFLIENQDHFLIGMRGTEADEKTVNEVQSGVGTPTTPAKANSTIGRSASNASAGADSVRKYGGVRRNVSVSSKHSRQSNGVPSPATPTYASASGGIHRSNTLPSKRSPALRQGATHKHSGSPSPTTGVGLSRHGTVPRGLSPADPNLAANKHPLPPSPGIQSTATGASSLAPSSQPASIVTSQDRLLGDPEKSAEVSTPSRERNVASFFQRSPTVDSERKQPNRLRKKRIPSSSNPSAQSSTHSLNNVRSDSVSPGLHPARDVHDVADHPALETIMSSPSQVTAPPLLENPRTEASHGVPLRPAEAHHSSDQTLKPKESPVSSLHSRSSFNDPSDLDHVDDAAAVAEQKEKRSRWRLSRRRERDEHSQLSPPKAFGSDAGAGASTSSVGSSARPRKSFTGDTVPVGTESILTGAQPQSSNDSGSAPVEDKKGPFGWLKNKMREKREDRDVERDSKSPPASTELGPGRGKSMDVKREDNQERSAEDSAPPPSQR